MRYVVLGWHSRYGEPEVLAVSVDREIAEDYAIGWFDGMKESGVEDPAWEVHPAKEV